MSISPTNERSYLLFDEHGLSSSKKLVFLPKANVSHELRRWSFWIVNANHPFIKQGRAVARGTRGKEQNPTNNSKDKLISQLSNIVFPKGESPKEPSGQGKNLNGLRMHSHSEVGTNHPAADRYIFITPIRAISPTSSKAMDILSGIFQGELDKSNWQGQLLEMGYVYQIPQALADAKSPQKIAERQELIAALYDPMTQRQLDRDSLDCYFQATEEALEKPEERAESELNKLSRQAKHLLIRMDQKQEICQQNDALGLAISDDEIDYLIDAWKEMGRTHATDAELMMFAQLNSEHCRHKIFNGKLRMTDDTSNHDKGEELPSLFDMIKSTSKMSPDALVSSYVDNAAIFASQQVESFASHPEPHNSQKLHIYTSKSTKNHLILKAETHNHPTFVSPDPGAATGTGGEIRDEIACGIGGRTKAGFLGLSLSDLELFGKDEYFGIPQNKASPRKIIIDAPLGSSNYANEFGRPTLGGYFRTLSCSKDGINYGYHKPILLAGGWGNISATAAHKPEKIPAGHLIVLIGDLSLKIGLGGGAMSSATSLADSPESAAEHKGDSQALDTGTTKSSHPATNREELDFASVQRANAESQRRGVEAIMAAARLSNDESDARSRNPIAFIHDLGAGGLGNAVAELLKDGKCGGTIVLENIPVGDFSMSASDIWCNESQERFILAIAPEDLETFAAICTREAAPYAVIGVTNPSQKLQLVSYGKKITTESLLSFAQPRTQEDKQKNPIEKESKLTDPNKATIVDMPLAKLFPKGKKNIKLTKLSSKEENFGPLPKDELIQDYASEILMLPSVASKEFLITIGDRFVGGLTAREQMVGPWQVPVSDYSASLSDFTGFGGEVCALGERTPLAVINPGAASRMALAEVVSNIAPSGIEDLRHMKVCANWMAATNHQGEMSKLYEAVRTFTQDICEKLGIAVPVGKDSLFMSAKWNNAKSPSEQQEVVSPVSLILSGLAPVSDLRLGIDPRPSQEPSSLFLVSPHQGAWRLGGTALAQVMKRWQGETPDIEDAKQIQSFFDWTSQQVRKERILAYHDISDGGLWATLCEMSFAARCGIELDIQELMQEKGQHIYSALFGEEMGAIIQVAKDKQTEKQIKDAAAKHNLNIYHLGTPTMSSGAMDSKITISNGGETLISGELTEFHKAWNLVSDEIITRRGNKITSPEVRSTPIIESLSSQVRDHIKSKRAEVKSLGSSASKTFISKASISKTFISKPRIAILREQGANSHIETAFAFAHSGFTCVDIHMNDLRPRNLDSSIDSSLEDLRDFSGLVFVGGFSYGDVMGAGVGWAANIIHNPRMKKIFADFFSRPDTFSLGICNGCQAMAQLQSIIPGANWKCDFLSNESDVFEARTTMVKILPSPSIFFRDMEGSSIPIVAAHGEGRAEFYDSKVYENLQSKISAGKEQPSSISMVYSNGKDCGDEAPYPFNPNGSSLGIASLTSDDGRATIMMPHPERSLRRINQCWQDSKTRRGAQQESPLNAMFYNARLWIKEQTGI